MGTIYCGPYADAIGYEDHEGYPARILPDNTETGTWTWETREFRGYRAHCACGWRGTSVHPPTSAGEDAALEDWDRDHLQPQVRALAIQHAVPAEALLALAADLRAGLTTFANDNGDEQLTEHGRGVCFAIQRLEELIDELASRGRR